MMMARLSLGFLSLILSILSPMARSKCTASCGAALASYHMWHNSNLLFVNQMLRSPIMALGDLDPILRYNKQISDKDNVSEGTRILVPFPCDCLPGDFLGHVFGYQVHPGDTYWAMAKTYYSNLTTIDSLENSNSYPARSIPVGAGLNVTVNCSCGDGSISKEFGLFITYPLRPGESLDSIANDSGVRADLLQRYNPGVDFRAGSGIVYIPGRDPNGVFPSFKSRKAGTSTPVIAGICVSIAAVIIWAAFAITHWRKKLKESHYLPARDGHAANGRAHSARESAILMHTGPSSDLTRRITNKSIEFSYEELAKATDNFDTSFKIGEGGFGSVFYAELRGEKAAIKRMEMQASKQFLAELMVLTNVHHVNLVRLIGFCIEGSLFLVYEYIENGNLGQHLHGSGREPPSWSTRVQIALDSARGLEYIHERTVPAYIHRDVKSANILIDKNYRAKVADFGLTKLVEVGNSSVGTNAMGTFGYMPPEYVYGDISAKADVYAFGVVLYELISAKPAIIKLDNPETQFIGLVSLFDEVFNQPNTREALCRIIDPKLGNLYPLDAVYEMAELAGACTQDKPQSRPQMKHVVVALMTLSSSTAKWDVGCLEDEDLADLRAGR